MLLIIVGEVRQHVETTLISFRVEIACKILEDEEWLRKFQQTARERLAARNTYTRNLLEKAGIR